MAKQQTARDHAKEAGRAHCDLNILYAVIAILEGGTISGACQTTTSSIIRSCKKESAKCLRRYDTAMAKVAPQ